MRIADHVRSSILDNFVGRQSALTSLASALESAAHKPQVVEILGPGGVGKTALISRFLASVSNRVIWVSCGDVPPTRALWENVETYDSVGTDEAADILVFDGFEHCRPIENWLFNEALSSLGEKVLVVLTTRLELDAPRRLGWSELLHTIRLDNLDHAMTTDLLARQGVPKDLIAAARTQTQGHPLAISLLGACLRQDPRLEFDQSWRAEVVPQLPREFLRDVPTATHASALAALSVAQPMTEARLRAVLAADDVSEVYRWARSLEFIRASPAGLHLHELIADVLYDDLAERDLERLRVLAMRTVDEILAGAPGKTIHEQRRLMMLSTRAFRYAAPVQSLFMDSGLIRTELSELDTHNSADAVQFVLELSGETEAERFQSFATQPGVQTLLVRDEEYQLVALASAVALSVDRTSDALLAECARDWEERRAGPDENAQCFRFYLGRTPKGPGPTIALTTLGPFMTAPIQPRVRHLYFPLANPDKWMPLTEMYQASLLGHTQLDGQSFGLFYMQAPPMPLSAVRDDYVVRVMRTFVVPLASTSGVTPTAEDIRHALRFMHTPSELRKLPLVREIGPAALVARLWETLNRLREHRGYEDSVRVLSATYFEPVGKQIAVAQQLGLPFGTYRYQLRKALQVFFEDFVH